MKKFISFILIFGVLSLALCFFASCKSDESGEKNDEKSGETDNFAGFDPDLGDILKSYKNNGLKSWWEILAVYNAGENPLEYNGFNDVLESIEIKNPSDTAAYVIVVNLAVLKGSPAEKYEKYEEYKTNLKNFIENPVTEGPTINNYIFSYFALKTSGAQFNEIPFVDYLNQEQKLDMGFALSGDSGDVDVTAFALQALQLCYRNNDKNSMGWVTDPFAGAVSFLENSINENGTFTSYGSENANSTACALSALTDYYGGEGTNGIIKKISEGLRLFKLKEEAGYAFLEGGKYNAYATAQSAIALSDAKNKMSVWEKLYLKK